MKEFTEKLISRLEEKIKVTSLKIIVTGTKDKPYFEIEYKEVGKEDYNTGYSSYELNNVFDWKDKCFEIVKKQAEEYLPDICVGNKDGWIPCSEKLPTRYCHCLVTRRNEYEDGFDTGVREDTYVEIEGIWDWQSKHEGLIDEIIAWMPLPEPYREKGE